MAWSGHSTHTCPSHYLPPVCGRYGKTPACLPCALGHTPGRKDRREGREKGEEGERREGRAKRERKDESKRYDSHLVLCYRYKQRRCGPQLYHRTKSHDPASQIVAQ